MQTFEKIAVCKPCADRLAVCTGGQQAFLGLLGKMVSMIDRLEGHKTIFWERVV